MGKTECGDNKYHHLETKKYQNLQNKTDCEKKLIILEFRAHSLAQCKIICKGKGFISIKYVANANTEETPNIFYVLLCNSASF